MELSLVRILFDFGLVVLIWIVQLIIYPSLLYFSKKELIQWHKKYTQGIFIIVSPMMIGQLAIAAVQLFQEITLFSVMYASIVFALWVITFVCFVKLHGKITDGVFEKNILHQLTNRNWFRTILWTALFIFSLVNFTILR
ncbi:hypothetical protein ULMS_04290 [Patiriisocius marinistellae]|uniref:Uncharacterized protein n=1 Tax=Patiriisocius marinistellae TaxID=2494560 RepID=A0A5J4FZ10_9FLAO|nr:hypothetical protein [Patiriisocius marinistellae]GEQ84921.1 hypothetical protein ULMS_04290 [Patiriisocius marinistellae]